MLCDILGAGIASDGTRIGRLRDLAVRPGETAWPVVALRTRTAAGDLDLPWSCVRTLEAGRLDVRIPPLPDAGTAETAWLAATVLDYELIDLDGKRVVRVGDIVLDRTADGRSGHRRARPRALRRPRRSPLHDRARRREPRHDVRGVRRCRSRARARGRPVAISVPVAAAAIVTLVVAGSFHRVERILLALAAALSLYIAAGLLAGPDWGAVLHGSLVRRGSRPSSSCSAVLLVPLLVFALRLAGDPDLMGAYASSRLVTALGWLTVTAVGGCVVALAAVALV